MGYRTIRYSNSLQKRESVVIDGQDRLIGQYFALFGVPDDYGTVPIKGCFAKSIRERGPKSSANEKIKVLWQHDSRDPLCVPSVLLEDDTGLYAEYEPDPIPSGDRCVIQVRSKTITSGSYGFNYVWDKMEYDEETDTILMKEVILIEISPVTFASQKDTRVVRSGNDIPTELSVNTDSLIKSLPRNLRLEARSIINEYISLIQESEPGSPLLVEKRAEKKNRDNDLYDYLINNLKL